MKRNTKKRDFIPLFKVFMSKNVMKPLEKVLMSGYIGQGPVVDQFEKKLQKFIGNPYVFTVNSGTSALHLVFRLIGVGPGDEVISTPMTCTATNWAVLHHGAKLVWADIDPSDGEVTAESVKKLIGPRTKAILVVDWGGYPCDISAIKKAAGDIPVVEDAAHAFGSIYKNKMVGNTADYTCYSFQAIKHLTTVDGGAVAVKSKKDFERGILLRWYGISRTQRNRTDSRIEIDVKEWGYKFHMNDVNAVIGIENLKFAKQILRKHRSNAEYYKKELKGLTGIELLRERKGDLSSYWLFTIKVKNRKCFMDFMKKKNIMVSQVHRRNDTHPTVAQFKKDLPGVDAFTKEMISIPVGWWVTKDDRKYIANSIKEFVKHHLTCKCDSKGVCDDGLCECAP
jgi:dTDP-4-amino-4,6-dideoxygalactose transaminase